MIQEKLFTLQDVKYAKFTASLAPTIPEEMFIGVRVPLLRKLAKELKDSEDAISFLNTLPHTYYEENVLHGLLIAEIKDYDACIKELEKFLPYVDNWGVCDTISPKVFGKHKEELLVKIREWASSSHTYICRFGIKMLMTWFLDGDFKKEYLEIPAAVHSEEYYVRMMVAWYFATALAKQWEATVPYIEQKRLDDWTHRKTIQKACESYRLTDERKMYLRRCKG